VDRNFIQTCSVLFRRDRLPELPEWYDGLGLGDWPLYVLLAERGPIAYLDEILAVYRIHSRGHWSSNLSRLRRVEDVESIVRVYEVLDQHLEFRHSDRIGAGVSAFCAYAAEGLAREGRHDEAEQIRRLGSRAKPPPGDLSHP
jgi:hypothetical protein